MSWLKWRAAEKADRALIERFTCLIPVKRTTRGTITQRPPKYEVEVDRFLHGQAMARTNADSKDDQQFWIGLLDESIAGAYVHSRWPRFQSFQGPQRFLAALAVALEHRNKGGVVARETLDHAIRTIAESESARPILVFGKVDPANVACKAMLSQRGFALLGVEGSYEYWAAEFGTPQHPVNADQADQGDE
ncbi:hypothetical protein ACFP3U_36505 [Kitasatospora misakiensis]|uniref:N-acetyltransferase domain-containing protein n=1 Tax=Kitasatospora misakiensis TaxID=67330 RepID=A0ABW0XF21_9ACTN